MHARFDPRLPLRIAASLALGALLAAGCSPEGERPREGGPTIRVEPLSGPPGTEVRVTGGGLPLDVVVDVGFGPSHTEYELIARTQTDGKGSTAASVLVPAGAVPGRPYVFVLAYPPTLLRLASDTFRVTAPTVSPASPRTDTARVDTAITDTAMTDTGTTDPAGGDTPAGEVRVTGRLTDEGVECPALRGDDGRLYTLAGGSGGFGPGDRVTVVGTVAEMSTCMQGTTIAVRSIERA